jgi:hypothetical protein
MTTHLTRRRFNLAMAAALATPAAFAQDWPAKPIRIIVPYPPGGFTDVTARLIGEKLGERLGQTVLVDNKAGANGTIGVADLARSAPDGHTFAIVKSRLEGMGTLPAGSMPEELAAFIDGKRQVGQGDQGGEGEAGLNRPAWPWNQAVAGHSQRFREKLRAPALDIPTVAGLRVTSLANSACQPIGALP